MVASHAVVVITYRRPAHLRTCLEAIACLEREPSRVVVVDQSPDDESREVTRAFRAAEWVDNRVNAGRMTSSRNVGLERVAGECSIVSFIDDDSLVATDWATEVIAAFDRNPGAGAVGGRVDNGNPEEEADQSPIGTITKAGRVIGNFGARRDHEVAVQHVVGANMSFRTHVLAQLGGFREDYPGTAMGEDTDVCLRVGQLGLSVVYASAAVVRHTSAPHVHGRRFGLRYAFFAASNFVLLMRRNFGVGSRRCWGQLLLPWDVWRSERSLAGRLLRFATAYCGAVVGIGLVVARDGLKRAPTVLDDARATRIRIAAHSSRRHAE